MALHSDISLLHSSCRHPEALTHLLHLLANLVGLNSDLRAAEVFPPHFAGRPLSGLAVRRPQCVRLAWSYAVRVLLPGVRPQIHV
eukprot:CAMPEP_0175811182 /NCGR_PEP_ID=MMETSP0107_2-20121207/3713_1 /TAXON_ID=195067 ORGANISM="Goniomonas pacifica, Strain CCMP1869" /NCGR_SAMPLE_ID=MMETSP0107_2 /ASSEMBLY_ACC=CAM_ASM_000203 /LENGTH=84 /DNA_ID=CAMNT_0017122973 /DNA_START=305 /DNA_END=559 /DNA_ORIENTATION=+